MEPTTKRNAKLGVVFVAGLVLVVAANFPAMFDRPGPSEPAVLADIDQLRLSDELRRSLMNTHLHDIQLHPRDLAIEPEVYVRDAAGDSPLPDVLLEPGDYEEWEAGEPDSPYPEEASTEVRAMKKIGLHCVLVEQLPLFDDFRMPTAEGNAFVKDNVQRRADEIAGWLDGTETREELYEMIWGGGPDGDQDSLLDWCRDEPNVRA